MFRWYVINTYSGHENKVKQNLEHRVHTMNQERNVRQVVVLIACFVVGTYLYLNDIVWKHVVAKIIGS